jgi:glucose-specific phosphotransferase system IIA component
VTAILSPCSGRVIALDEVPDPVFAGRIVGPGVAIDPDRSAATVVAPISGRLVKLHPHAFVIAGADVAVLVHLGIDTVQLGGAGFTLHATERTDIAAGDPIVTWDPADIEAGGRSPVVPIILLDVPGETPVDAACGPDAVIGEHLLTWPADSDPDGATQRRE